MAPRPRAVVASLALMRSISPSPRGRRLPAGLEADVPRPRSACPGTSKDRRRQKPQHVQVRRHRKGQCRAWRCRSLRSRPLPRAVGCGCPGSACARAQDVRWWRPALQNRLWRLRWLRVCPPALQQAIEDECRGLLRGRRLAHSQRNAVAAAAARREYRTPAMSSPRAPGTPRRPTGPPRRRCRSACRGSTCTPNADP